MQNRADSQLSCVSDVPPRVEVRDGWLETQRNITHLTATKVELQLNAPEVEIGRSRLRQFALFQI